jgi:hypothetical protein
MMMLRSSFHCRRSPSAAEENARVVNKAAKAAFRVNNFAAEGAISDKDRADSRSDSDSEGSDRTQTHLNEFASLSVPPVVASDICKGISIDARERLARLRNHFLARSTMQIVSACTLAHRFLDRLWLIESGLRSHDHIHSVTTQDPRRFAQNTALPCYLVRFEADFTCAAISYHQLHPHLILDISWISKIRPSKCIGRHAPSLPARPFLAYASSKTEATFQDVRPGRAAAMPQESSKDLRMPPAGQVGPDHGPVSCRRERPLGRLAAARWSRADGGAARVGGLSGQSRT